MRSFILLIFISMYSPNLYADWVTVYFFTSDEKNIGSAEGVDSWFLGLPAFKFNLKHLKPGEYSIHHVNAVHGSGINKSENFRIGFAIRYVSSDTKHLEVNKDKAIQINNICCTNFMKNIVKVI